MVTGIDLAKEQLRVAAGEELSFTEVEPRGHAIEFRINAEDPARDFLPGPGKVVEYREPSGFGIRVDSWIRPGTEVTPYYDNLMAKLVVWGRDRKEALARSRRALTEFHIRGVPTTIPAHLLVLDHPLFQEEAFEEREMTVEVGGRRFVVRFWAPEVEAPGGGARRPAPRRRPPKLRRPSVTPGEDAGVVTAPMQGTIVKVMVKAGQRVKADQPVCILEAMKMENEVRSPVKGEVVDLRVQPGDTVATGAVLAIVR
jgi:acetyl-CoA/propionyl-CoA carboxylase biotin carboxyl carrier protein